MEQVLEILQEIRGIGETSNPVVGDLATKAINLILNNPTLTHKEMIEILDRKEGIDPKD